MTIPTFGTITLKFGADGNEGEPPLTFEAGHINLIVGPNDAGKSLMLRELSGVNPRAARSGPTRRRGAEPTRIVASAGWSTEYAAELRQHFITAAFDTSKGTEPWHILTQQPWDTLVPALPQAIAAIRDLRARLSARLLMLLSEAAPELPPQLDTIRAQLSSEPESAPWVIGVGVLMDVMGRMQTQRTATSTPDTSDDSPPTATDPTATEASSDAKSDTPHPADSDRDRPIAKQQSAAAAAALRAVLNAAWSEFRAIVQSLCPEIENLELDDLLVPGVFATWIHRKFSENPLVANILASFLQSIPFEPVASGHVDRIERPLKIAQLFLSEEPLEDLHETLESLEDQNSWTDAEVRRRLADVCLYLDGLARLTITDSAQLTPYEDVDAKAILALLKNPDNREILRDLVHEALGRHLVIDMATDAPRVHWRLATEAPPADLEANYTVAATNYHREASPLDERSDGIHAYVGMLAAILATAAPLTFIDEPEAFLHPPLTRTLARQLALLAREHDRQFYIATHSPDLLAACVSSGASVNIIRLTHDDGRATARKLDADALRRFALDPLLRSEAVLSALFQHGAVVTESESDRLFYGEINARLIAHPTSDDGIESCAFLYAQNRQTVDRIIGPLREMGVAAAAIVDSDALFGDDLRKLMKAARMPDAVLKSVLTERDELGKPLFARLGIVKEQGKELPFKGEHIAAMQPSEREVFEHILDTLARYGIFLVPVGVLEDWLSHLGLQRTSKRKKAYWLEQALDKLGWDPESDTYMHPSKGDIWDFMRKAAAWIRDGARKGTSLG